MESQRGRDPMPNEEKRVSEEMAYEAIWQQWLTGKDQLRARMGWALLKFFVISNSAPDRVPPNGRFGFEFYNPQSGEPLLNAVGLLLNDSRSEPFEQTWLKVLGRSIESQRVLAAAVASSSPATPFPNTGLGQQLQMAAKLIGAQAQLGLNRQCFFTSLGGFDTHADD